MKINIKYMVSLRCKLVVRDTLDRMGLLYKYVDLGEVDLVEESITSAQYEELRKTLQRSGLELMDEVKSTLVEKIKNVVVEMIHYADELPKIKTSLYISKKLNQNYTYLSNLFKEVTGTTIQHFIVIHKIEKVKELILYDELNLNEISDKLNYSSVAHLSNQFKQITGLSPSFFKKLHSFKMRIALESI
jgi:AraC-like DNA-binding protein